MSKDKKTYRTLSEEEIRDYLAGRITGKKAHEIERFLLNNPFEREAVEGFEQDRSVLDDLDRLRKGIDQRSQRRTIPWLRVAASVLLMVSASVVWWYLEVRNDVVDNIAMNETATSEMKSGVPEVTQVTPPQLPDKPKPEREPAGKETSQLETAEEDRSLASTSGIESEPPGELGEPENALPEELSEVAFDMEKLPIDSAVSFQASEAITMNDISVVEGYNDNDEMTGQESSSEAAVAKRSREVQAAYEAAEEPMARSMMEEQSFDQEAIKKATPKGGWEFFREYIKESIIYPDEAKRLGVEGTVYLQVEVNTKGEIEKLTVLRGLEYGCDEEAKRLVKEGPEWDPAIENGEAIADKVVIPIKFKL